MGRRPVGLLLAALLLGVGIAGAVLLPNVTTCPSCPPLVACACRTDSQIPLRLVVAAAGLGAALLVIRITRPARRTAWHEA